MSHHPVKLRKHAPASMSATMDEQRHERGTNTEERAEARTERNMSKRIMVKTMDDLHGLAAALRKGASLKGIRVFMPGPEGMMEVDTDAVERLLLDMAGEGEQTFPTPGNQGNNFPTQSGILTTGGEMRNGAENAPAPPQAYVFDEPGLPRVRLGYDYALAPVDPNIGPSAEYDESVPEDRPQGPAPVDFTKDVSPIFKSQGAGKVSKRGIFAGLVDQSTSQ